MIILLSDYFASLSFLEFHPHKSEIRKGLDVPINHPIDKDELNNLIDYFINEINFDLVSNYLKENSM